MSANPGQPARPRERLGRCQCGSIRLRVQGLPRNVHYCHCSMYRRAVANAFATLIWFGRPAVEWLGRQPARYRSSAIAERGFCPDCGTPVFLSYDGSDQIALMLGVFDGPEELAPTYHYGIESRLPWVDIGPGLTGRPTAADPRPKS